MMKYIALILLVGLLSACGNEAPTTENPNNTTVTNETNTKQLKGNPNAVPITKEPLNIEPQDMFDQSQLNSKVLGLCVQFKTLEGANRKAVFDLLEPLLPNCPMKILDNNETEADPLNAKQMMSVADLIELIGQPTELREDGTIVYNLMADGSYRVTFKVESNGAVACRAYEADS